VKFVGMRRRNSGESNEERMMRAEKKKLAWLRKSKKK